MPYAAASYSFLVSRSAEIDLCIPLEGEDSIDTRSVEDSVSFSSSSTSTVRLERPEERLGRLAKWALRSGANFLVVTTLFGILEATLLASTSLCFSTSQLTCMRLSRLRVRGDRRSRTKAVGIFSSAGEAGRMVIGMEGTRTNSLDGHFSILSCLSDSSECHLSSRRPATSPTSSESSTSSW
ncbi:hypothetical protein PMAYCL1PPCAC_32666, partial [Pristionchus mayeri]